MIKHSIAWKQKNTDTFFGESFLNPISLGGDSSKKLVEEFRLKIPENEYVIPNFISLTGHPLRKIDRSDWSKYFNWLLINDVLFFLRRPWKSVDPIGRAADQTVGHPMGKDDEKNKFIRGTEACSRWLGFLHSALFSGKSGEMGFYEIEMENGEYFVCTTYLRCTEIEILSGQLLRCDFEFGAGPGWSCFIE